MTAINIIRKADSVAILVDGAGYDHEGYFIQPLMKCITIPHLRAAVATRGSEAATPFFAGRLATFMSFDDAVAGGPALLASGYDEIMHILARSRETECQIFLAGWSEAGDRPESYVMTSFYTAAQGLEPWKFHPLEEVTAAPLPTVAAMVAAGCRPIQAAEDFDPVADGIRLMEAQRNSPQHVTSGKTGDLVCTVGAFAMVTTLTREGIDQRIVHRWPDVLAERMNAGAAVPVASGVRQLREAPARGGLVRPA